MKVAIYTRVSTDGQTTEQQVKACKRYCDYKEFIVKDTISEIASGKNISKRPKFRQLWDDLRCFKYDGIVVFRIDRLGRNVRDMVMFFDEMHKIGIEVHSISESLDASTPIGRAMINMMMVMAQLERENISVATKQRLDALRSLGKTLGRPKGSKDTKKRKSVGYLGNKNRSNKGGSKNHEKL